MAITENEALPLTEKYRIWEQQHLTNSQSLSDQPPTLVSIRDHSSPAVKSDGVFPPVNHENLNIDHPPSQSSSATSPSSPSLSSQSSSSFSPYSDSNFADLEKPLPDNPPRPGCPVTWWSLGLHLLFSRINSGTVFSRCVACVRTVVTRMFSSSGVVALLLMFVFFRRRRRRLIARELLGDAIREKDERINQLLSQIAELNKVLLAMHKGNVPKN